MTDSYSTRPQIAELLQSVRHPVNKSESLPPLCYTDTEWLRNETEVLFHQGWILVTREDQIANAGDYFSLDLAGTPVVLIRDQQGRLGAWSNSCRHRGMKLLAGEGNCKAVVCPFHGWSYDLDGSLVSAPRMEDCPGFDNENYGMVKFQLACRNGFVFVKLAEGGSDIDDWLGDFEDIHAPWKFGEWTTTRLQRMEVDCNWKTFIEVFNEYYHLPYVHRDSITHMYREPEPTDPVMGEYTTQFGITEGTAALLEDNKSSALPAAPSLSGKYLSGTRYTWIYPNTTFAACFDSFWMYQAFPLGPNRCQVLQTICFPTSSLQCDNFETKAQDYYARIDTAISEDLPFLEQQQIGLNSQYAKQGRFSALEPSVGNFACWYAERMREALGN